MWLQAVLSDGTIKRLWEEAKRYHSQLKQRAALDTLFKAVGANEAEAKARLRAGIQVSCFALVPYALSMLDGQKLPTCKMRLI